MAVLVPLAAMGATVEVLARNPSKAKTKCQELRDATGNPAVGYVVVDTGDLPLSARAAAAAEPSAARPTRREPLPTARSRAARRASPPAPSTRCSPG